MIVFNFAFSVSVYPRLSVSSVLFSFIIMPSVFVYDYFATSAHSLKPKDASTELNKEFHFWRAVTLTELIRPRPITRIKTL